MQELLTQVPATQIQTGTSLDTNLELRASTEVSSKERRTHLLNILPEDHKPYTDKYFLRTNQILEADGLDPLVRAQIFIRKGPGELFGMDEVLTMLKKYTKFFENGGKAYAKNEGDNFQGGEALLILEGKVRDFIELETMMLGALSRDSSKYNDGVSAVNPEEVRERMSMVVEAAQGRPVIYAGARHWGYEQDKAISLAAFTGGALDASTDAGAETFNKKGVGTIPHALEVIYAWKFGRENAVKEATLAFDRVIDSNVPRVALVDFNNREIDDALATAQAFRDLGKELYAVRVDTCGENIAQGALLGEKEPKAAEWLEKYADTSLLNESAPYAKYWYGRGVTVTGVYALRKALDQAGFENVKIILSSGFGKAEKVKAFVQAEELLGVRLFDALLAGEVWNGGRIATMDLVAVGESAQDLKPMSKVGRPYRPNPKLLEVDPTEIV